MQPHLQYNLQRHGTTSSTKVPPEHLTKKGIKITYILGATEAAWSTGLMTTMAKTISTTEYAKQMGVDRSTVIGWIHSGQLRAVNVATKPRGPRKRFRISAAARAEFERRRETMTAPPPPPKREARDPRVIEFIPEQ